MNRNQVEYRSLLTFLFGLFVMWIGLWRCIELKAFNANAFYFCLVTGAMAIAAGFLYWTDRFRIAMVLGLLAAGFVTGYYLFTFVTAPEKDANLRVGLAIIAGVAELIVVLLPRRKSGVE